MGCNNNTFRPRRWVLNASQLAEALDCHRSSVHDWKKKGLPHMPGEPNRFYLPAAITWLFSFGPWRNERSRDDYLRTLIDKLLTEAAADIAGEETTND